MALIKYSTVPLEVISDDEQNPAWVKKASEEDDERRKLLVEEMQGVLDLNNDD
jgi:hypothetical protein